MRFLLWIAANFGLAYLSPTFGKVSDQDVLMGLSPAKKVHLPYDVVPDDPMHTGKPVGIRYAATNHSKQPWNTVPDTLYNPELAMAALHCGPALKTSKVTAGNFWYERIVHDGSSPFIPGGANWKVFRNVVQDYGADNSGNQDARRAIQNAIDDGSPTQFTRTDDSLGTTGQPAVVYLPAGTYTLNSAIQLYVGTVLMGDPLNPPTLKASPNFQGNTLVFAKDPHHDPTIVFYIGIKNLVLDSNSIPKDSTFNLLDWSVSQATQLTNVEFKMPNFSSGHTGIAMEEANKGISGTFMGDLTFHGGATGIDMNGQQMAFKSMTFNGCTTGVKVSSCFDCTFVNMNFMNAAVGLDMTGNAGFIALLDSTASNVGAAVKTFAETTGDHSLVVENFSKGSGVGSVVSASGNTVLADSVVDAWVYGNAYTPNGPSTGSHQTGTIYPTPRSSVLLSNGKYVTVPPPTYQEFDVSQFVNVKQVSGFPVHGDGVTDDTANLQNIISSNAGSKILFFPQGTYIVTNTLLFPPGSRVFGEAWSAISATGPNFKNADRPIPMIKVGNPGDRGVAQFSDMLFTVADILPGCILLETNIAGSNPGDVGFWNTHFRVGGAAGSRVQTACTGSPADCMAAFALAHLTPSSSAYIENMWGWTADHDLDGGHDQSQISVGRGMLVEATTATWLHGTAMEHNTLYQYNLVNAQNVFAAMQQSETPYWQGPGAALTAPKPWTPIPTLGDPDFSGCGGPADDDSKCRMAWFSRVWGGSRLFLYGSGFWTFFNGGGACATGSCQTNAVEVDNGVRGLYYFGLTTKSNENLIRDVGAPLVTENNNPGGWGGCVAAFLRRV